MEKVGLAHEFLLEKKEVISELLLELVEVFQDSLAIMNNEQEDGEGVGGVEFREAWRQMAVRYGERLLEVAAELIMKTDEIDPERLKKAEEAVSECEVTASEAIPKCVGVSKIDQAVSPSLGNVFCVIVHGCIGGLMRVQRSGRDWVSWWKYLYSRKGHADVMKCRARVLSLYPESVTCNRFPGSVSRRTVSRKTVFGTLVMDCAAARWCLAL